MATFSVHALAANFSVSIGAGGGAADSGKQSLSGTYVFEGSAIPSWISEIVLHYGSGSTFTTGYGSGKMTLGGISGSCYFTVTAAKNTGSARSWTWDVKTSSGAAGFSLSVSQAAGSGGGTVTTGTVGFPTTSHLTGSRYSAWRTSLLLRSAQPASGDYSYAPISSFVAGTSPYVHFLAANFGSSSASLDNVKLEILNASSTVVKTETASASHSFQSGGVSDFNYKWSALSSLSAGSYTLRLTLNPGTSASGSGWSNVATYAFTVTSSGGSATGTICFPTSAHLAGTEYASWSRVVHLGVDVPTSSAYLPISSYAAGSSPCVQFLVGNLGSSQIPSCQIMFEVLDGSGRAVLQKTLENSLAVQATSFRQLYYQWEDLATLSAGSYTLRVTLDPNKRLTDADRSDNVATYAFAVMSSGGGSSGGGSVITATFGTAGGTVNSSTFALGQTLKFNKSEIPDWVSKVVLHYGNGSTYTFGRGGTDSLTFSGSGYFTVTVAANSGVVRNWSWDIKDTSGNVAYTLKVSQDGVHGYAIAYQFDGGTPAANTPTSAKMGEWLVLPSPTRPGYVFGGWQAVSGLDTTCSVVSTDGIVAYQWWPSSAVVGAGLPAFIISNLTREGMTVTLKALWIENKYDLVYQLNGGTAFPGTPTSARMGEWLVLPSPTRAGYRFGGWQAVSGLDTTCAVLSTDGIMAYQWWPFEAVVGAGIDAFVISDLGRAGGTVTLKALWTK